MYSKVFFYLQDVWIKKMVDRQKVYNFADWLAIRQAELKLNNTELAERIGVSHQTISNYRKGTIPRAELLPALANALEIDVISLHEIISGKPVTTSVPVVRLGSTEEHLETVSDTAYLEFVDDQGRVRLRISLRIEVATEPIRHRMAVH